MIHPARLARCTAIVATILLAFTLHAAPLHGQEGAWLVFSSQRSGDGDIYGLNLETRELRVVEGTAAPEGAVRYDPLRDRLVYHRYSDSGAILVAGGGATLFVDPNGDVAPAWSSRGEIVYEASADGQSDLFVADSLGRNPRRLTRDAAVERYPSWSPDGRRVVYAKRVDSAWDLYAIDLSSGTEDRLTFDRTYVGHPSWSPDGRWIAFDTLRDGQAEIALLSLADGSIRLLTERPGNDLIPSWSPDGSAVAFGGEGDSGNWDVWLYDLATGRLERLTDDPASDGGPVFVPGSALGR